MRLYTTADGSMELGATIVSGHTNRNRRNGGNPRSRHGAQRQRGGDGRAGQPKNNANSPQRSIEEGAPSGDRVADQERTPSKDAQESSGPQPITDGAQDQPTREERPEGHAADESPTAQERRDDANPPGRRSFNGAGRGSHAYIPANPGNGARPGENGQNGQPGQNGHSGSNGRHGPNGRASGERRAERQVWTRDEDEGESDGGGDIPRNWRIERLNGGTDTTPHEPFRPESRGAVGPLIDTLHEIFAQDRSVATRGDSARCGICYLHFPLAHLEYRESEGFYVCEGCKRALGHQQVMMVRRQQAPHGG